jgi:hypothetical protein
MSVVLFALLTEAKSVLTPDGRYFVGCWTAAPWFRARFALGAGK